MCVQPTQDGLCRCELRNWHWGDVFPVSCPSCAQRRLTSTSFWGFVRCQKERERGREGERAVPGKLDGCNVGRQVATLFGRRAESVRPKGERGDGAGTRGTATLHTAKGVLLGHCGSLTRRRGTLARARSREWRETRSSSRSGRGQLTTTTKSASTVEERPSAENGDIGVCSVQSVGAVPIVERRVTKHAGHCEKEHERHVIDEGERGECTS